MNFTKIEAWASAKQYFIDVYDVTRSFPPDERYGFTSQMRRAARSVCADIAEGSGYTGNQDSARFYRRGYGSSNECYSDMHLALAVGLLTEPDFERLEDSLLPARKQLYKMIKTIDNRTGR